MTVERNGIENLLEIMQRLRQDCPWDRAQTPLSLTPYAIEEAYEVEQAIRIGDTDAIRDELGDLLLQVVFQAEMYREQGVFDFADVVESLQQKLIRRHPHVFEPEHVQVENEAQLNQLWQDIKQREREQQNTVKARLDRIKPGPALMQAHDVQKQAAKIGFDFPTVDAAYEKFEEELAEFQQARLAQDSDGMLDELGDCLFSLVNVARKLNLNSEVALLSTLHKFRARFAYIEAQAARQNQLPEHMHLDELDQLWEQAKKSLQHHVATKD